MTDRNFCIDKFLHKGTFTCTWGKKNKNAKKIHTEIVTHKSPYTEGFYIHFFARWSETFTHGNSYTQTRLHNSFYIEQFLHTIFLHRENYTREFLHTEIFYTFFYKTHFYIQARLYRESSNVLHREIFTNKNQESLTPRTKTTGIFWNKCIRVLLDRSLYTKQFLHNLVYTTISSHRGRLNRRRMNVQHFLHTEICTEKNHTEKLLDTVCTQFLQSVQLFAHNVFYQNFLHTNAFTQGKSATEQLSDVAKSQLKLIFVRLPLSFAKRLRLTLNLCLMREGRVWRCNTPTSRQRVTKISFRARVRERAASAEVKS